MLRIVMFDRNAPTSISEVPENVFLRGWALGHSVD